MKPVSLFNDVLGPVMRGPSSSHTAGSYHIGAIARSLLGEKPASVRFAFDPEGSYAQVFRRQGSDLGLAAGMMGWAITDERFEQALDLAPAEGIDFSFAVEGLPGADHPNTVEIAMLSASGRSLSASAKSTGGGTIVVSRLNRWPVHITGDAWDILVESDPSGADALRDLLSRELTCAGLPDCREMGDRLLVHVPAKSAPPRALLEQLRAAPRVHDLWVARPVFMVPRGEALFRGAAQMVDYAQARSCSLGRAALDYECTLLGLSAGEVLAETTRRYEVMKAAVRRGLEPDIPPMQLLSPSAGRVYTAEADGRLAAGGLHTRAAARAMAVMHVNGAMGVVCAAPTAGSAGVIPAVAFTLAEEMGLTEGEIARALLAAGAIGLVIAARATFAAEVAGCQVEIGAAGAMAAAAVVEAAGGSPRQASDAAAIALQNTMGSICDLVQGIVEIPCHTRNAVAASSAFVCADLILGGYANPVPLDETVDAMYAVGRMLPRELRCTALGGLATAPSALRLQRLR